jgi:hypothetical protein
MIKFAISLYALIMTFVVLFGGDPKAAFIVVTILTFELAIGLGLLYILTNAEAQDNIYTFVFGEQGVP